MEKPLVGTVVVVEFPYSGFKGSKKRPALVIGHSSGQDVILCQITSQNYDDNVYAELLRKIDFTSGSLPLELSYIRPDKIFTFPAPQIMKSVGKINQALHNKIKSKLKNIFGI